MFNWFLSLFSNDIGIDLGTSTVLVYVRDKGIVLREPSVVAVNEETKTLVAVGEEAKKMIGRTPSNIRAIRPLREGVIADFDIAQQMIRYFIEKVHTHHTLLHPRVVIGVPSGITEVERRAVREAALQAGVREVYLIKEPMAAAIGTDLPVSEPTGNIVCDIGGGTTEVAVICLGGIVVGKSIRVAGDKIDEAIVDYLKKKYNLLVGERTAEEIKIAIGSAYPTEDKKEIEIKGRDIMAGLPKTLVINDQEIAKALDSTIMMIVSIIKAALEETPPELSSDIMERGIILAGGGALLRGIDKRIAQETGLPVHLAPDPLVCVALGTGKYLEELDRIKKRVRQTEISQSQ